MTTWHVYQLRANTELLYVGYSRWLTRRLGQHRREKPWWPEVTDVQSEEFASEEEARRRERELWVGVRPKYNRQSPFVTDEDVRERTREQSRVRKTRMTPEAQERYRQRKAAYRARPEVLEAERERDRKRNRTPKRRALKQTPEYRAYMREYRRRTAAAKRQPQAGPGLF